MNCGCDEFGDCYDHKQSRTADARPGSTASGVTLETPADTPERNAVRHPPHYNAHPSGVACITIVEHFNFNVGNAVKYLWRAGLKSASPIEDLKKAAQYIAFEIERQERRK